MRRKIYVCQVCEETFDRSYQLNRHCFIGDHNKQNMEANPQAAQKTNPAPVPTQPFKRQTYKLISATAAQSNGIDLNRQNSNLTYIRNTFVNNGKPPLQFGAKRPISSKKNGLNPSNGITAQPLPIFKIEGLTKTNNTAHVKVKVELPDPVPSNNSRTTYSEVRSTHSASDNNSNTPKKPIPVTSSSKYFTNETEHEWNQIVYQVQDNVFDEILLKCAVCNFVHSDLTEIDKHLTIHNGAPFRFQCQLCDAWFGQQQFLINHVNGHTVTFSYKCDWCEMAFKWSESLRVHTACEEPACSFDTTGRQLFQCNVCRKTFLNEHLFRSHNTEIHGGGKPYRCDICKAEYLYLASLIKHHECDVTCELPIKVECR